MDLSEEADDPNEQIPPPDEHGCHAIYAQNLLPTFELTIDEDTWDELDWEWEHGAEQDDNGLDPDPQQRTFDDPSGDLWKRQGWKLQTNKDTGNDSRLEALKGVESIEELETHMDVEQALSIYAAEAILPNGDGGWAGGKNFYLYDDPLSGVFKLIPWDLDATFERFDGKEDTRRTPIPWCGRSRRRTGEFGTTWRSKTRTTSGSTSRRSGLTSTGIGVRGRQQALQQ